MVNVVRKPSSQDARTNIVIPGVVDCETAVHCKQHATNDTVNILKRRRTHEFSIQKQEFDVEGRQTVDGVSRHCSRKSCFSQSDWGSLIDRDATVCGPHTGDSSGRSAINFTARCKVEGCTTWSSWGINGKQPTHCAHHGPLENSLVCVVSAWRVDGMPVTSPIPSCTVKSSSLLVKAECSF